MIRWGTLRRPSSIPHAAPGDCKGGWRPSGGGHGVGNLGNAYDSHFSQAIEYHTQHLAMAKEVGDWAGMMMSSFVLTETK